MSMIPSFRSAGTLGRRAALRTLTTFLLVSAAGLTVGYGKANKNKAAVCVDLSALSSAERKRRKLDNYTEMSSDPGKTCSGCTFFIRGAESAACGQCQMFNGPANSHGRCDDWTARPA